ncbi:MAG: hypothetical protein IH998_16760, partial [Proteobacteria bacterium]|nr:hypothetical protein [Pseudomonadota bacterium]
MSNERSAAKGQCASAVEQIYRLTGEVDRDGTEYEWRVLLQRCILGRGQLAHFISVMVKVRPTV